MTVQPFANARKHTNIDTALGQWLTLDTRRSSSDALVSVLRFGRPMDASAHSELPAAIVFASGLIAHIDLKENVPAPSRCCGRCNDNDDAASDVAHAAICCRLSLTVPCMGTASTIQPTCTGSTDDAVTH